MRPFPHSPLSSRSVCTEGSPALHPGGPPGPLCSFSRSSRTGVPQEASCSSNCSRHSFPRALNHTRTREDWKLGGIKLCQAPAGEISTSPTTERPLFLYYASGFQKPAPPQEMFETIFLSGCCSSPASILTNALFRNAHTTLQGTV